MTHERDNMGTFTSIDYDYSALSLDAGYAIWRENEGLRARIGYGYSCRGTVVPGPHWSGRWVATGGMGNCGRHYIVPVSPEARRLVRQHVTTCWAHRHGMSYAQTDALYDAPTGYKYELIERIAAVLRDPFAARALAAFPGVGPGSHLVWRERWGAIVDDHIDGLSWPRVAALAAAVAYVAEATT